MINRRRHHQQIRRGAAAVEFAVMLPFIAMLLLGSIEFGRTIMAMHVLQEAAQAGSRVYSVSGTTQAEAEAMVDQALSRARIEGYTVTFDPPTKGEVDTHLEPVTVTVSVGYEEIGWTTPWYMGGAQLEGRCTMPADLQELDDNEPDAFIPEEDDDDDHDDDDDDDDDD